MLKKARAKKISFTILLLVVLFSFVPYLILIMPVPTTLLFPISLLIIIAQTKIRPSDSFLNVLLLNHTVYFTFSLGLLTSNANTWGNFNGFIGIVSVTNAIAFMNYFSFCLETKKWHI